MLALGIPVMGIPLHPSLKILPKSLQADASASAG
jgi:hypothetical protein